MTSKDLNRRQMIAVGVSATMAPNVFAQFGKKKNAKADGGAAAAAADGLMPAGTFAKYIALASDLGTQGTMQLPPVIRRKKSSKSRKRMRTMPELCGKV